MGQQTDPTSSVLDFTKDEPKIPEIKDYIQRPYYLIPQKEKEGALRSIDPEDLDFTKDEPKIPEIKDYEKRLYDPRPHEDAARRRIAYSLIGLLCSIIFSMLVLLYFGIIKVEDLKEFGVILSPIITLVSAATGFYYGIKSN